MNTAYKNLSERFAQLTRLQNVMAILGWDESVMMPAGAGSSRGREITELAVLTQKLGSTKEIGAWLAEVDVSALGVWERANVREMKRAYVANTAVPLDVSRRLVEARIASEQRWRELRAKNDWASFLPHQHAVVELTREALGYIADARGVGLYDAALDKFSPGLNEAAVETLFAELKIILPKRIQSAPREDRGEMPRGNFPPEKQKALARELMIAVGFSFEHGRLDETHHPFCDGTPQDVRVANRYDPTNFLSGMMGLLHETGHALYHQNLPPAWHDQPVGNYMGMAIHESQSLFWEMQICRSAEFARFAEPRIRHHLGAHVENPDSLAAENLTRLNNQVRPGLIRVDADALTYPMHIILRFELERDLVNGKLKAEDIPEAWDEKMRAYLGLTTAGDDRRGCMQDMHWPAAAFGYFPAYTFGAVIAAQLFAVLRRERPGVNHEIARGEFAPIRAWLNEKVWSGASCLETMDLVGEAVGPLSAEAFLKS